MEEKKEKEVTLKFKKSDLWKIITALLGLILIASILTGGFNFYRGAAITEEEASERAINYVNKYLLEGDTATLIEVNESKGIYQVKIEIRGQAFDTFITKDGTIFFPAGTNLEDVDLTPQASTGNETSGTDYPKTETPTAYLFTMSFCPGGNGAEEAMKPVAGTLGEKADIQPHYVVYPNYCGYGQDPSTCSENDFAVYCIDSEHNYCSMHGLQELTQDIRELCVYKYDKAKYWDFVSEINSKCSYQNADTCWESIASDMGIDTEKIKSCEADEALDLLAVEAQLNAQYGVSGSPTLIINDQGYGGARTPEAYKEAICSAFTTAPEECGEILSSESSSASTSDSSCA